MPNLAYNFKVHKPGATFCIDLGTTLKDGQIVWTNLVSDAIIMHNDVLPKYIIADVNAVTNETRVHDIPCFKEVLKDANTSIQELRKKLGRNEHKFFELDANALAKSTSAIDLPAE